MRAKEISFIVCPFLPAGRQEPGLSRFGGMRHVPVNKSLLEEGNFGAKDRERMEIDHLPQREG